jgi:hypothetical protein
LGLGGGNALVRSRRHGGMGSMAGASYAGRAYIERIERDHEGSPFRLGVQKVRFEAKW